MDHEGIQSRDHIRRHASSRVTDRAGSGRKDRAPASPLLATDCLGKLQARGF